MRTAIAEAQSGRERFPSDKTDCVHYGHCEDARRKGGLVWRGCPEHCVGYLDRPVNRMGKVGKTS